MSEENKAATTETQTQTPNNGAETRTFTQEQLDRIVKERLDREKEAAAKKYGDYDELKAKVKEMEAAKMTEIEKANAEAAEAKARVEALEAETKALKLSQLKTSLCAKAGLPAGFESRVNGEDEAAITADIEALKALLPKGSAGGSGAPVNSSGGSPTTEARYAEAMKNGDKEVKFDESQTTLFPRDSLDFALQSFMWAEAKRGTSEDIYPSFVQLILTIGKERTYEKYLPPMFLGAFDAEKIAFIEYSKVSNVFYQNDFNWNVTPSNHETKEFKQLHNTVSDTLKAENTLFYYDDDSAELKTFVRKNFVAGRENVQKIVISKTNFTSVYLHWLKTVKPTIEINWESAKKYGIVDADFYLADLLSRDNESLKESLFVLLKQKIYSVQKGKDEAGLKTTATVPFKDKQEMHKTFWNRYIRPPKQEFWNYIIERRDLLVPQDIREYKGSFFTPQIWVEKSRDYLEKVLGDDWQDEYYIWDCCAGTGNMEVGLIDKYKIFVSTLDKADVDVMKELAKTNTNLLESHIFQFDFLNDSFDSDKVPQDLKNILKDEEKRKKLLIYINPPYAEAATSRTITGTGSNKTGVAVNTKIYKDYEEKIKLAGRELFVQFLTRIYAEISGCKIGNFSKLKVLNAPNFIEFRDFFKAKLLSLFIMPANTFDNVKGEFPIGFHIWDTDVKEPITSIVADVYNKDGNIIDKKTFGISDKKSITEWLITTRGRNNKYQLGFFFAIGNDFQHANQLHIVSNKSQLKHPRGSFITDANLVEVCLYYSARKAVPATWINDRDQFTEPNEDWKQDREFQGDCVVWTLFDNSNKILSEKGTNHWIPFTEKEIGARGLFDSHFMSDFLSGKVAKDDGLFSTGEKYSFEFSDEARDVLKKAKRLYCYYHAQKDSNPNASYYDIREYFQGRDTKGRMNNSSQDDKYNALIADLREAHNALAKKIEPKIYEYGFLER